MKRFFLTAVSREATGSERRKPILASALSPSPPRVRSAATFSPRSGTPKIFAMSPISPKTASKVTEEGAHCKNGNGFHDGRLCGTGGGRGREGSRVQASEKGCRTVAGRRTRCSPCDVSRNMRGVDHFMSSSTYPARESWNASRGGGNQWSRPLSVGRIRGLSHLCRRWTAPISGNAEGEPRGRGVADPPGGEDRGVRVVAACVRRRSASARAGRIHEARRAA